MKVKTILNIKANTDELNTGELNKTKTGKMKHTTIPAIILMVMALFSGSTVLAQENGDTGDREEESKKISALYKEGRKLLHKREFSEAIKRFREIIEKYNEHRLTDDSMYWMAYSMNKMSKSLDSRDSLLKNQEAALEHLQTLAEQFGSSRYVDDANRLKIEIAESLVNQGFKNFKKYIEIKVAEDNDIHIQMIALEALMNMDKEKAFPTIERILKSNKSSKLKEKAIFILSQSGHKKTVPLMLDVAKNDKDRKVREKAIFWLSQIRGNNILKKLVELYKSLGNQELKIKEKIIFAISQHRSKDTAGQLIALYKNETQFKLKKKILFYLGQTNSKEAEEFIQSILLE